MSKLGESLDDATEMGALNPLAQAEKAIVHTLNSLVTDPRRWELMGYGTQTFSLLTEAAATLLKRPVGEVRRQVCDQVKKVQSRK